MGALKVHRGWHRIELNWQNSGTYTPPHQFEPLMSADARMEPLLAGRRIPTELRSLLRNMNSYYTNRIETQHTSPPARMRSTKRWTKTSPKTPGWQPNSAWRFLFPQLWPEAEAEAEAEADAANH